MGDIPLVVGLPIADRQASFAFYRDGLGFDPVGEPGEDGVPEPLQFAVNGGVRVMLIPRGGFGWITGDHDVAPSGSSECVLTLGTGTNDGVDGLLEPGMPTSRPVASLMAAGPNGQSWVSMRYEAGPSGRLSTSASRAAVQLSQ